MTVPEFMRFYNGYNLTTLLNEYAVRFYSMLNAMYRLQAREMQNSITSVAFGMAEDKHRRTAMSQLEKTSRGLHGILQEVRFLKGKK